MNKIELPQSLIKIKDQLKEIDKEYQILGDKQQKLEQKYNSEVRDLIKSQNFLNRYKWELDFCSDNVYLSTKDKDDYFLAGLMLDAWDHYSFELGPGVWFQSDDGRLQIAFEDEIDPINFIKDWNITLNFKCIDSQIEKLRTSIKKNEENLNKLIVIKDKYYKINE